MARSACKQLARSQFCSSPTHITPLLASSAACQRFHFLPAAIISHGKICLQAAGKKSILLLSDTYHPPSCKQRCLPAISFLASSNYFSWQDLLARSWQEVNSALPTSCHEKRFLLASKLFAGKQRCLQEGGVYGLKSRTFFLPAAIISHGKICLQEAGKKSILLFQLLAMRSGFCWQANYLLASSAACKKGGYMA